MKLIVGLGNPGVKYRKTRHNVGFMVIDELAKTKKCSFKKSGKFNAEVSESLSVDQKVLLVKPQSYMNNSGICVKNLVDWYDLDLSDLLVVYDDLDLPLSQLRYRNSGSSAGHNGLESIIQHLGSQSIKRIKLGIGRDKNMDPADYVLQEFSQDDWQIVKPAIDSAVKACIDWVEGKTINFSVK